MKITTSMTMITKEHESGTKTAIMMTDESVLPICGNGVFGPDAPVIKTEY